MGDGAKKAALPAIEFLVPEEGKNEDGIPWDVGVHVAAPDQTQTVGVGNPGDSVYGDQRHAL